jgi:hypothetical protein
MLLYSRRPEKLAAEESNMENDNQTTRKAGWSRGFNRRRGGWVQWNGT